MRQDRGRVSLKYKTVVIDPPWPIVTDGLAAIETGNYQTNPPDLNYNTVDEKWLMEFPLNEFAADKSLLFLWVTGGVTKSSYPIIKLGFDMLREWGFTYRAMLYWSKKNAGMSKPFLPFRCTVEPIMFASRGYSQIPPYGQYSDIIHAPRRSHSEKPYEFYQLLRAWTPTPRIDIFARNAHEGFDGWGDEYVGDGPLQEFLQ